MNPVIDIQDLSFTYPDSGFRLSIQEFRVARGERIFLHGPSGSGKSTFLNLICGLLQPSSGKLQVLDLDMTHASASARDQFRSDHLGCIFQQFNLIPYLSAEENILISAWNSSRRWRRDRFASPEEEARFLAKRLDVSDVLGQMSSKLSVGQQQRIAAARSFMGAPELLIADEPTSALDVERQADFIKLLIELASDFEMALLFVSHNHELSSHFERKMDFEVVSGDLKS
jgi:putative ABC transport system ATP-binding protein